MLILQKNNELSSSTHKKPDTLFQNYIYSVLFINEINIISFPLFEVNLKYDQSIKYSGRALKLTLKMLPADNEDKKKIIYI